MSFYSDLGNSLLEAIEIEKGNIPMKKKENMPAPTFVAIDKERELIDKIVEIRKESNISQNQLAGLIGSKQQAISRLEKKEHSPSLKMVYSIAYALGYDIKLVKR